MCGFIGIYGPEGVDVAGLGLVLEVFNESNMARLRGNLGVGHVRYPTLGGNQGEDAQPFHLPYPIGVAMARKVAAVVSAIVVALVQRRSRRPG